MPFIPGDGSRLTRSALRAIIDELKRLDSWGVAADEPAPPDGSSPQEDRPVRHVQLRSDRPNAYGLYDATVRFATDYEMGWPDLWPTQNPEDVRPDTEYQVWAVDLSYTSLAGVVASQPWFKSPVPLPNTQDGQSLVDRSGEVAVWTGDAAQIAGPASRPGQVGGASRGRLLVGSYLCVALGRPVYAVTLPPREGSFVQVTDTTLTDGRLFAGQLVYEDDAGVWAPALDDSGIAFTPVWLSVEGPDLVGPPPWAPEIGDVYLALPQGVRAADGRARYATLLPQAAPPPPPSGSGIPSGPRHTETVVTNVCPVFSGDSGAPLLTGIVVEYTVRDTETGEVLDRYCASDPTGCCAPPPPSGSGTGSGFAVGGGMFGPPWDGGGFGPECLGSLTAAQSGVFGGCDFVNRTLYLTFGNPTGNCGCLPSSSIPICYNGSTGGWDSNPGTLCGQANIHFHMDGFLYALSSPGSFGSGNVMSCHPFIFEGTFSAPALCSGQVDFTLTEGP
jgi:hypothetical protein